MGVYSAGPLAGPVLVQAGVMMNGVEGEEQDGKGEMSISAGVRMKGVNGEEQEGEGEGEVYSSARVIVNSVKGEFSWNTNRRHKVTKVARRGCSGLPNPTDAALRCRSSSANTP